jgi:GWxTD domain-containing protein
MSVPVSFRLSNPCFIFLVSFFALLLSPPVWPQSAGSAADQFSTQLPPAYQRWLDQDVRWIMSNEEREGFLRLNSNRNRDRFIEEFWKRRDPTPATAENEYKEEHYRRLAYADAHFGWGKIQGWETDRGRLYIFYGPPDAIKDEPVMMDDGRSRQAEIWRYNYMERLEFRGNMNLTFIDFCGCGDYRVLGNPTKQDMPGFQAPSLL